MQQLFFAQVSAESGFGRWTLELASGNNYDIEFNKVNASELGNTEKGDGPRYKGTGYVQLTGKANYQNFKDYLESNYGIDDSKIMDGDEEMTPAEYVGVHYPWEVSGFYWDNYNIGDKLISQTARDYYTADYTINDYAGALIQQGQNSKIGKRASELTEERKLYFDLLQEVLDA